MADNHENQTCTMLNLMGAELGWAAQESANQSPHGTLLALGCVQLDDFL
jgi:hypothetical protein